MKKKTAIIIGIVLLLTAGLVYVWYSSDFLNLAGQQNINEEFIATVNGEGIKKSDFEIYKKNMAKTSASYTDGELLEKLIRQKVFKQELVRLGYEVSDEEVEAFNNQNFTLIEQDPKSYQIIKDHVDESGMTMEEYKEKSKEFARLILLGMQYREDLMEEFDVAGGKSFEDYYQQTIDEMVEKAKVEYLN